MGEMDKSTEKSKDESEVLAKQEKENDECKPSENNSICEDAPVYAAILSNSPKRHIFKELREMKQFLDSPENRSLNSSKTTALFNFFKSLMFRCSFQEMRN